MAAPAGGSGSPCSVCLVDVSSTLLRPCGHVVMCSSCAARLARSGLEVRCPVCRQVVEDVLEQSMQA